MRVPYACAEDDLEWAGLTCTDEESCVIYLELSAVAGNGRSIFAAGNLHSSSATLSSILLMSEDAGATWKEPAARTRGSALDQLQFFDSKNGWAAGETQYPLPRDSFVLLTRDGGASWRQQAVGEDGSPGSVQRFWFDSATHGELIVDAGESSGAGRYLSYESETGGDNWMLTGKSGQMPQIRRAPASAENPDWRARPSKDGKAFQIERRSGDRWTPLASFLIQVANCKIRPAELKAPEPDAGEPGTAAAK